MEASHPRNVLYVAAAAAPCLRPLKGGWRVGDHLGTGEEENEEEKAKLRQQLRVAAREPMVCSLGCQREADALRAYQDSVFS